MPKKNPNTNKKVKDSWATISEEEDDDSSLFPPIDDVEPLTADQKAPKSNMVDIFADAAFDSPKDLTADEPAIEEK